MYLMLNQKDFNEKQKQPQQKYEKLYFYFLMWNQLVLDKNDSLS